MAIVVEQTSLVLGHFSQVRTELLRLLVRRVEVWLELYPRAETFELVVKIIAYSFQSFV